MAGVALRYFFPLLFTTLFATANFFNAALGEDDKISCLLKQQPSFHTLGKTNCLVTLCDVGFGIKELCLLSESLSYGQKLKQLAPSTNGRFSDIGYTIPNYFVEACTCDLEKNKLVQEIVEAVRKIERQKAGKRFPFLNGGPQQRPNLAKDRFNYLDKLIDKYNNEQLEKKFMGLDDAASPILNYYNIMKNIIDNLDSYGFDQQATKTACCGWGPSKVEGCGSPDSLRCEEYINYLLARIFWNGNKFASQQGIKSTADGDKTIFDFR